MSGKIAAFICPGCMVTSPVLVSLIDQYSPVWLVVMVEGAGIGSLRGGKIVVTLLAMMAWPLSSHTLVLYLCTLGTCLGQSSSWYTALLITSVSFGIICRAFCGGVIFA